MTFILIRLILKSTGHKQTDNLKLNKETSDTKCLFNMTKNMIYLADLNKTITAAIETSK